MTTAIFIGSFHARAMLADNRPNGPLYSVSSLVVSSWTSSLERLPEIVMKDVDDFLNIEKAPKSGRVKGYKFFMEGFIHELQGLRSS